MVVPGEKLPAINSKYQDAAPELNATPGGIEIFFHSNRGGARQIYRGACSFQGR